MVPELIPMALPTPTGKEVAGFIALYRAKYGIELDPSEAGKKLSGLMRFLYLTQIIRPIDQGGQEPSHPTQLTARKSGQSRKKA